MRDAISKTEERRKPVRYRHYISCHLHMVRCTKPVLQHEMNTSVNHQRPHQDAQSLSQCLHHGSQVALNTPKVALNTPQVALITRHVARIHSESHEYLSHKMHHKSHRYTTSHGMTGPGPWPDNNTNED